MAVEEKEVVDATAEENTTEAETEVKEETKVEETTDTTEDKEEVKEEVVVEEVVHSKHFETVKGYYESGLWNIDKVLRSVVKSWITESEYNEITGFVYPNKE